MTTLMRSGACTHSPRIVLLRAAIHAISSGQPCVLRESLWDLADVEAIE